ncbi:MAG TPA: hypothetical protein VJ281_06210 [Chthoniobacterales bacterium]|nr:hypothetical protein [Chthoniobacterales bacterium]
MKIPESWEWAELRHKFVLTAEEKRVISFVVAALLLGTGTKYYRDSHPKTPIQPGKKHAQKARR